MNTTKILIADDHALMRLGIRSMLELQPDMSVVGGIIDWIENDPIPAFTQKQLDVLHALSRGLSNKDIAHLLGISAAGVQKHLDALFAKLGAATRAEAVSIAFRRQILK